MTKEEEIAQLKRRLDENNYKLAQLDIQQSAYKLIINSAYGALSSRQNPLGDDDIGNAITVMGSTSIQHVNKIILKFVRDKMIHLVEDKLTNEPNNEALQSELESLRSGCEIPGVLIANDTDSAMFSLSKCGVTICNKNKVTKEGYKLVEECDDYINNEFVKWYQDTTNSHNCRLNFKREKICDFGLWLKKGSAKDFVDSGEAKKNYVVHILDNEGVKHPKFKYTGVKFAKSTISSELKELGKRVVESMILTQDRIQTDRLVQSLYDSFLKLPINTKAMIQRCRDMQKYSAGKPGEFLLSTPGHVKAAMNYNYIIDLLGLKKYEHIKSGDIVKIVLLESNQYNFERIAYLDEWPEEFNKIFRIDEKKMFEKSLYEEIRRFYLSMNWPYFNPTNEYSFSLYDLLDGD